MGIIHLAPVGRSPGAVTAPLAHLKHVHDEQQRSGKRLEKSVLPRRLGYPVEQVVLFVPEEIYRGQKGSGTAYEAIYNQYGSRTPTRVFPERDGVKVVDIIAEFAKRELSDGKLVLYARPVNVNNFDDCFRAIAEAVLALGRPDDLGKTLWANLTGGTNVLNAALLEVTFLSGLISSLYYIFVNPDEQKFLQPLSTDYRRFIDDHWRDVPVVKTTFDERYRQLLLFLTDHPVPWDTAELLARLQNQHPELFGSIQLELFGKQWLRKMSREIELESDPDGKISRIQITEAGYDAVARIEENLFRTLVQRGDTSLVDIQALRDKLEECRV
jgi:hypothetical protein